MCVRRQDPPRQEPAARYGLRRPLSIGVLALEGAEGVFEILEQVVHVLNSNGNSYEAVG